MKKLHLKLKRTGRSINNLQIYTKTNIIFKMKKSDLKDIILEIFTQNKKELLMEKFASPIIADINNRIAGGRSNSTQLWNSTANSYGIAWDKVKDEHVSTSANPRRDMLNIFFVAAGTENPYADYQTDYVDGKRVSRVATFYRDGLLGIAVGKKVIGFTGKSYYKDPVAAKKSKRVDLDASNYDKVGSGVDAKVWNYKRMLEISTEVFSIDIAAIRNWNVELKSLRSMQKHNATAMDQNADILKANKQRYKLALKDLKDAGVEGKEFDIVLAHLDDAEQILTKELKNKIKETRKGVVYPGWDSPFELAVNLHKNMVDKFKDFQRYSKSSKKEGGSWYEQYLTDIAHDVAEIKMDFDKRLARAIAQGPVEITESVLPVYESNKYTVAYSDGVRGGDEFKKKDDAMKYAKDLIRDNKRLQYVSVHRPGMTQTAHREDLLAWWGPGDMWDNKAKKDKTLYDIQIDESVVNEEYVESMNSIELDKHLAAIEMLWLDWKRGPMTEPSDIKPAQKEVLNYITNFFKKAIK